MNNPQAFPRTGEGFGNQKYDTPGMTLRDYFAASAITGMLSESGYDVANREAEKEGLTLEAYLADTAYKIAEAMLNRREV